MIYRSWGKRVVDVVLATIGLPVAAVVSAVAAVFIKREDGGPVFYLSTRLGRDERPFSMVKLRSMSVDAPDLRNSDGSTYNDVGDPRVTAIGGILRRTSADELPQLLNVLKGDMSLVGPRPSPLGNQDSYSADFRRKFTVRPGITGYNQALLRNSATMQERIANDCYYVDNMSLGLDLKILWWTLTSAAARRNIHGRAH